MKLRYPNTRKVEQYDDYFGTVVHDPYRWLEEDSPERDSWINEQNTLSESFFSQIPFRNELRTRIEELMNFPRFSNAKKVGEKYFFLYNDGLQEQSILYVQDGFDGEPRVLLDPHTFSDDGSLTLASFQISNDRRYMSYCIAKAGSDWVEVRVVSIDDGAQLLDHVEHVFVPETWEPHWFEDGFFYTQLGDTLTGKPYTDNDQYIIRYHKIGTSQADDAVVWSDSDHPEKCFNLDTSQNDRAQFLFIYDADLPGNKFYVRQSLNASFIAFHDDPSFEVQNIGELNGVIIVYTNLGAPTYRIVRTTPDETNPDHWQTIVPARDEPIEAAYLFGNKLIVLYSKDAHHQLYQYDLDGNFECEIDLPGIGTISHIDGWYDDPTILFEFSSFTFPRSIYEYSIITRSRRLFRHNEVPYPIDAYETRQVFVGNKDGTHVPMFIVARKDLDLTTPHPTILHGYGGFNVILAPLFRPPLIAFLEQGGIYVQANLRGGGEYGLSWYEAGIRSRKQNSFDDFIAAAEYLCNSGCTDPQHLAISGSSHGGLLVGAVLTQRPGLFAVAISDVGVHDMLRYHHLGGYDFARDYGLSNNEEDFHILFSYSPLHNLAKQAYPATLIRTADHDDRVSPSHSYKFAAALQVCQTSDKPVLLSVSIQSGHGKGLLLSQAITKIADDLAFVLYHTNSVR
jgi:prolyl oligopeptidase